MSRKNNTNKPFFRLLNYARPFHRFWPGFLIFSILSVVFSVANYALIDPLLTLLFQRPDAAEVTNELATLESGLSSFELSLDWVKNAFQYYLDRTFLNNGPMKALLFVCFVLVGASLIANVTRYFSQAILVRMRTHIMQGIRSDLFRKVSTMDISFYHTRQKGDILSRVSNDVTEVQNGVADSFPILFREPLQIIGFLVGLFIMSPKLTVVTLFTVPLSALVIGRLVRKLKRKASTTQKLMGRIVGHFDEAISGLRIIKAFNAQKYVSKNFEATNAAHRRSSLNMFYRQAMAHPLSEFLGIAIGAAVLFYGGWLQINGELGMDMPKFVVYIAFYWRVLEPAKNISNAYASIQRGMVSGERLFTILDAENKICDKKDAVVLEKFSDGIEYRNVDFTYDGAVQVLKNVNVKIPKGRLIALVGPSGAGKSTFADLLPRFYDVTGGQIMIDGRDIRDYTLDSLTRQMGIVTQESILFNDTVYNNIVFGMENVSKKDVIEAAKIANAYDFIMQLPEKFETNIGDRGENLSGGQRQRIAIARAVLKNPPILILDEATSALDTESEKLVQEALGKLMKNRTSIVIAHRLSTIKDADDIVVLKDGCVAEEGNHDELLAADGIYAKLCALQVLDK